MVIIMHAQVDMSVFPILRKILSHGYLSSGFLPLRIAFPTLTALLLGSTMHTVGDDVLVETPSCVHSMQLSPVLLERG